LVWRIIPDSLASNCVSGGSGKGSWAGGVGWSVRGSSSEHVLGSIQVTANIRAGSEVLKLFFTETRIIVAHVGKRGMGSLPATSIIGKWGAGFEGLLRSPSESRKKRKMEQGARNRSAEDGR